MNIMAGMFFKKCFWLLGGILWILSSCSSVSNNSSSAPSVSIPAPTIGRLTISTPDDDGISEVTGEVADTDANSVVLVTNANQASSETALRHLLFWIPEARAQSLPGICSRTGRACGTVDSDGIFRIQIATSEDDNLEVVVIDITTASELSSKISQIVPRNFYHFALPAVDVSLVPGQEAALVVLNDNAGTARIAKLNLTTKTRESVSFNGSSPIRILLDPTGTRYLILDNVANGAALVEVASENFSSPTVISLPGTPTDAVFDSTGAKAWISFSDVAAIAELDLSTEESSAVLLGDAPSSYSRGGSTAIAYINENGTEKLAVISRFKQSGSDSILRGLTVLNAATGDVLNPAAFISGLDSPFFIAFADATTLLATDTENSDAGAITLADSGDFSALTTLVAENSELLTQPRVVTVAAEEGLAFVTANNNAGTRADTVLTVDLATLEVIDSTPVGFTPFRMVWDAENQELLVTSIMSRSLTRFELSALLPGGTDPF
jgi:hypothetical protein